MVVVRCSMYEVASLSVSILLSFLLIGSVGMSSRKLWKASLTLWVRPRSRSFATFLMTVQLLLIQQSMIRRSSKMNLKRSLLFSHTNVPISWRNVERVERALNLELHAVASWRASLRLAICTLSSVLRFAQWKHFRPSFSPLIGPKIASLVIFRSLRWWAFAVSCALCVNQWVDDVYSKTFLLLEFDLKLEYATKEDKLRSKITLSRKCAKKEQKID